MALMPSWTMTTSALNSATAFDQLLSGSAHQPHTSATGFSGMLGQRRLPPRLNGHAGIPTVYTTTSSRSLAHCSMPWPRFAPIESPSTAMRRGGGGGAVVVVVTWARGAPSAGVDSVPPAGALPLRDPAEAAG